MQATCESRLKLNQQRPCSEQAQCSMDADQAREICQLPAISGPCRGSYTRFAYSPASGICTGFTYGGCRGNANNFLTREDCMETCHLNSASTSSPPEQNSNDLPVDCVLSGWTEWSPCSVTCGIGRSEKYRNVQQEARNGGQPCPPKRIYKSRKCFAPPCH